MKGLAGYPSYHTLCLVPLQEERKEERREKRMSRVLIVADDLTGAADSCLPFQKLGYQGLVLFDLTYLETSYSNYDVLCIDTETRHASPAEIERRLDALQAFLAGPHPPEVVFKKVDSTLRGSIGVEIDRLVALGGFQVVIVAPAFPRQGRQTIHGVHFVNSIPIAQTEFANDPRFPVTESHLPTLLRQQTQHPVVHIHYETLAKDEETFIQAMQAYTGPYPVVFSCDAVSDTDLQMIAVGGLALSRPTLLVGSAGLAEQVALCLHRQQRFLSSVLMITGSLSHVTRDQIDYATAQGVSTIFLGGKSLEPSSPERDLLARQIRERIAQGGDLILSTQDETGKVREQDSPALEHLYDFLSMVVKEAAKFPHLRGLVLVGGETALHIITALGASGLKLEREILPAVPASRLVGGPFRGLPIVTKAGGFGTREALLRCLDFLKGKP
ncbi:MAG: four-carbon acid sugar kinase family protein [Nitrospinota bacterium]|nr:MAG: four-carbon acid sugar kinase family protein [Nitrospinota bacterium]